MSMPIVNTVGRQHFYRHCTIEPRVPRFVDLAHPAGPAGGEDFVRAESSAEGEGQSGPTTS